MNRTFKINSLSVLALLVASAVSNGAMAAAPGNAEAGKALSQPCQACHGADGNSTAPIYPRLAGQYADYLARALHEYRDGGRENPIMAVYVEKLSDQDIRDLATYFSAMPGKLDDLHGHMETE